MVFFAMVALEFAARRKQRVEVGRGSDTTPSLPQPDIRFSCLPVSQKYRQLLMPV